MCNAKAMGVVAIAGIAAATGGFGLLAAPAAAAGGAAGASGLFGGMSALQTAGLLSSVAGTGLSAYGQYQQAEAAKSAAEYNQKVAEVQSRDAITRGDQEGEMAGRKIGALRGRQRAALAASGVDLSSGSAADILAQTDYYGLEDQRTIADNARREAAMYTSRAGAYGAEAGSITPWLAGTGTLLSGAGAVADRWYNYTEKPRGRVNVPRGELVDPGV